VAQLAGRTCIVLTSKVGPKTFVTLKLAQGVPRTTVMGPPLREQLQPLREHRRNGAYRKKARQVGESETAGSDATLAA
jgi:hypothetical protein